MEHEAYISIDVKLFTGQEARHAKPEQKPA